MHTLAIIAAVSFGAIILIWFGYPVAIWLVALVARRRIRPDYNRSHSRSVSVVLATRDSPAIIEARVRNLLDTEHPAECMEVIVALDADGAQATAEVLSHLDPRVCVVLGDAPGGKACALNAGVRAATGEVLVLADAAQLFDRRTIPELVACLEDARFGAVSGALTLGRDGGRLSPVHWYWAMEKWLRYNESLIHSSIGVTGAVYATRRATWPVIPDGTILDDVYVPMSLVMQGKRVGFSYAAMATDVRGFNAAAEGTRKVRTLTGVIQLTHTLHGITSFKNPVFVQFVMHKLARLATPYFLVVSVLTGLMVMTIVAITYPREVLLPTVVVLVFMTMVKPLRSRLLGAVAWAASSQRATVNAVRNGLAGRWAVWKK